MDDTLLKSFEDFFAQCDYIESEFEEFLESIRKSRYEEVSNDLKQYENLFDSEQQ